MSHNLARTELLNNKSLALFGNEPRILGRLARCLPTELFQCCVDVCQPVHEPRVSQSRAQQCGAALLSCERHQMLPARQLVNSL